MSKAHFLVPTGPAADSMSVRLGASATPAGNLNYADTGKLVKFAGESRYDLAAVGDLIWGQITSVAVATSGGWTIGGVNDEDMMWVTADGLQATPGTGNIAVGDYVVVGTPVAKGTAQTTYPRVCKATNQLGSTPADLASAGYLAQYAAHAWVVVSLGNAGTGAPGTAIVIKPLN